MNQDDAVQYSHVFWGYINMVYCFIWIPDGCSKTAAIPRGANI